MLISTKRSYSNYSSSGKDGRSKKVHCKARPAALGMTIGVPTYRLDPNHACAHLWFVISHHKCDLSSMSFSPSRHSCLATRSLTALTFLHHSNQSHTEDTHHWAPSFADYKTLLHLTPPPHTPSLNQSLSNWTHSHSYPFCMPISLSSFLI